MLHSPLTNEADLKMDDPRIPEVIRHLNPQDIELAGHDAVVMCAGKPAEYHLSRSPSQPRIWILYLAGPGYFGHQEILRFEHDWITIIEHMTRYRLALCSYWVLFVIAPAVALFFISGRSASNAGVCFGVGVVLAVIGERGFRAWKHLWKIET